jgi:hypothetical protein
MNVDNSTFTFLTDFIKSFPGDINVVNTILVALVVLVGNFKKLAAALSLKKTTMLDVLPGRTYYT